MFKLRLLSTLLLLPLVIAGILFLPTMYVEICSGIAITIAIWEWLHMSVLKRSNVRFVLLIALLLFAFSIVFVGISPLWILYTALLWWICALAGICYYPKYAKVWQWDLLQPLMGFIMFIPPWLAFNGLHACADGPIWVLLGCALVWGADIGAYCFGKLFGKYKLIPHVSPNKTWAGLYGGFAASCLIMMAFYVWYRPEFEWYFAIFLALITSFFAVVGDLFESLLKRIYAVKDSGNLIPGHGGMYDRIDSLLAAFPVYFLCLYVLQNICVMRY